MRIVSSVIRPLRGIQRLNTPLLGLDINIDVAVSEQQGWPEGRLECQLQ